jgi:hypothetical protein
LRLCLRALSSSLQFYELGAPTQLLLGYQQ